ncbi:hypothetical protein WR25_11763 [Diploscapter pachys]|uniref:Uncharacterized protein n=1 Tax=Diploscapter pachys TaxID=2018661 RepID=A0A2A2JX75_9BILA|nr:hypothetical protein WR25_11763 [Diploscapter pachys]
MAAFYSQTIDENGNYDPPKLVAEDIRDIVTIYGRNPNSRKSNPTRVPSSRRGGQWFSGWGTSQESNTETTTTVSDDDISWTTRTTPSPRRTTTEPPGVIRRALWWLSTLG